MFTQYNCYYNNTVIQTINSAALYSSMYIIMRCEKFNEFVIF